MLLCIALVLLCWASLIEGILLEAPSVPRPSLVEEEGKEPLDSGGLLIADSSRETVGVDLHPRGKWAIHVFSHDTGEPIAGAGVHFIQNGALTIHLGSTNHEGLLEGDEPLTGGLLIIHPEYSTRELSVRHTDAMPISVGLWIGGEIRGQVITSEGAPASSGVLVVAWETAKGFPRAQQLVRVLENDPRTFLSTTDENGKFTISQLTPGIRYTLAAGSAGMVSPDPVAGVLPSNEPITIMLYDAFWALVTLVDQHDVPILRTVPFQSLHYGTPRRLGVQTPPVGLLTLASPWMIDWDRHAIIVFCASSESRQSIGPFEINVSVPGYDSRMASVYAFPVREGPAETYVTLQETGVGRGLLAVRFIGLCDSEISMPSTAFPLFRISLNPIDGRPITLYVEEIDGCTAEFQGIPFGIYECGAYSSISPFGVPRHSEDRLIVEIGPDISHLDLDLTQASLITIELLHLDGAEYHGPLQLFVQREEEDGVVQFAQVFFERGPYVLPFLEPGSYVLIPRNPRAHPVRAASSSIAVEAGQRLELVMQMF